MEMIINKTSLLYRFLNTNFIASQWRIPYNLCPFMRRVVAAVCITAFIYAVIAALGSLMVFSLIALFVDEAYWGPAWPMFFAFGATTWVVLIGVLLATGWAMLCDRYHPVKKATNKVATLNAVQATAKWYQAVHDKVCPKLAFYTTEENDDEPL